MHTVFRAPKEFWLGVLYLVFGGVGLWVGLHYPIGTTGRMGPGYMPCLIASLLLLFGVISLVRAVRLQGEAIGSLAIRPLLCVLGGVSLFAFFVERLGLILSIFTLVLVSAAASRAFRFQWLAAAGLVGFVAVCCLIFVMGLGVPLPLFGSWFGR